MIAWFYSQVLTEPSTTRPCSWHWQILTQSQSNTSEFRVLSFTTLEPRVLHAMALFTAWWPGTPRAHPGCLHTRGKSGHNLSVGTCQTCPENSTSRLTVRMLLRAPHTRGEFKWLHYIHWPVDCGPGSGFLFIFLLSWVMLCPHGKAELCAEGLFNPHTTSWASPNTLQFYTFRGQAPHDLSPNL